MAGIADAGRFAEGVPVIITDYEGHDHHAVALSGVEGRHDDTGALIHDFPVVWVNAPRRDRTGVVRVPWPLTHIRLAD